MELSASHASGKLRLLGLMGLLFVGLGVWIIGSEPAYSFDWWTGGVGGVVFFGVVSGLLLKRSFESVAALIVNQNGIFDRRVVDAMIPWTAIESAAERHFFGQHFVALYLSRPRQDFIRSPMKTMLALLNRPFGFGDINISFQALDISADSVRSAISHYVTLDR
jgi:hypothetical protein